MISGTYTTIKLGGEITAEFGISYSNQILSSYVLFREHGRYMSLLDIKKTSLKDTPDESYYLGVDYYLDIEEGKIT